MWVYHLICDHSDLMSFCLQNGSLQMWYCTTNFSQCQMHVTYARVFTCSWKSSYRASSNCQNSPIARAQQLYRYVQLPGSEFSCMDMLTRHIANRHLTSDAYVMGLLMVDCDGTCTAVNFFCRRSWTSCPLYCLPNESRFKPSCKSYQFYEGRWADRGQDVLQASILVQ